MIIQMVLRLAAVQADNRPSTHYLFSNLFSGGPRRSRESFPMCLILDVICTAYRCTSLPREGFLLATRRQHFNFLTIANLKLCCVVPRLIKQHNDRKSSGDGNTGTQFALIFSKCDDFEGLPAS